MDIRDLAISIISEFEDLLEKHNIKIPDDDRTGEEDESCLFGETYYSLEDDIVELIENFMEKVYEPTTVCEMGDYIISVKGMESYLIKNARTKQEAISRAIDCFRDDMFYDTEEAENVTEDDCEIMFFEEF